ncbi:MAG: DUF6352 family protein [Beijerinckiaceae bacterium]
MNDFWISSGHHLLDRSASGGLIVTDEYLKAFLARPELLPPPEACPVELGVHAQLLQAPRGAIAASEIALMQDADARENWAAFLAFRDHLLRHETLEAAYVDLFRKGVGTTPPLFINQLVHVITRNMLDGETDAATLRTAELLFRAQKLTLHEGAILLADAETIEGHEQARAASPLLTMLGGDAVTELDVLNEANAADYAGRSDAFDMVLDFRPAAPSRAALGHILARWIRHLLGHEVHVEFLEKVEDTDWTWFAGLDSEGTRIGNMLWTGKNMSEEDQNRTVALYSLTFADPAVMTEKTRGKPVYLILGMTPDAIVRLKPQNLLTGLPLARTA